MCEKGADRIMAILPFFHVFAMTTIMNRGISNAAMLILVPRFDVDMVLKLLRETRPTIMPGVPTLFNALRNHPKLKPERSEIAAQRRVGRRALADRAEAQFREGSRRHSGGGLWAVGNLAGRHLQSAGWAGEGGLDRPAHAAHRSFRCARWRTRPSKCRSAKRARSASPGRR